MGTVNVTIDGKELTVADHLTVLQAAEQNGIRIPTLCSIKKIAPRANCRICLVEIDKFRVPQPACATRVGEGMVIRTNTEKLRKSRKNTLELILSDHAVDCHHCLRIGSSKCDDLDPNFCEMCFFCDCVRDGFCELQALAREYKVDALPYEIEAYKYEEDCSTGSIVRNPNKCIKCRRCLDVCNGVQTVGALSVADRGQRVKVEPVFGKPLADTNCIQCGRCAQVCPTGAIYVKEHKDELVYYAHSYDTKMIAQIPGEGMAELAELFGVANDENFKERICAGFRKIGVDYVVEDAYAVQNANAKGAAALEELLERTQETIILTNSNSARKFVEKQFPELVGHMLVYPSAQQEFGKYAKAVISEKSGFDVTKIKSVSAVSQNENAAEAFEHGSVDYVVNARELYRIFLRTGVDPKQIRPSAPDVIPDRSKPQKHETDALFAPFVWDIAGEVREMAVTVKGTQIKTATVRNLGQVRALLEEVKRGNAPYRIIRIGA